jgi:hypothetical protein
MNGYGSAQLLGAEIGVGIVTPRAEGRGWCELT